MNANVERHLNRLIMSASCEVVLSFGIEPVEMRSYRDADDTWVVNAAQTIQMVPAAAERIMASYRVDGFTDTRKRYPHYFASNTNLPGISVGETFYDYFYYLNLTSKKMLVLCACHGGSITVARGDIDDYISRAVRDMVEAVPVTDAIKYLDDLVHVHAEAQED